MKTSSNCTARLKLSFLLAVTLLISACTSMGHLRNKHPEPHDRLNLMLSEYSVAQSANEMCLELNRVDNATVDCQRIVREVARLYAEFPQNERILMSNAVISFDHNRFDAAQYYLDQLLGSGRAHPEAAILRSQIALKEGNSKYAMSVLESQIMLSPNRHELREAQAAAFYLAGKFPQALATLDIATRLGAPIWRLAYHQGLIYEAKKDWRSACRQYDFALSNKVDYVPAQARLIGLSIHPSCNDLSEDSAQAQPFESTPQIIEADN